MEEAIEIQQRQVVKKMGMTPETVQTPQLLSGVQVPQVQVVPETVEIPKLPFDEKIVVIPEIQTVQGPETSESLNEEFDAGHDEKSEQDALARQPHSNSTARRRKKGEKAEEKRENERQRDKANDE